MILETLPNYDELNEDDKTYINGFYHAIGELEHVAAFVSDDLSAAIEGEVISRIIDEAVQIVMDKVEIYLTANLKDLINGIVDGYEVNND